MQFQLVSVIVPVYNVDKYLNNCIQSIIQQSYRNIEIILVDDGSSDNSSAICDDWKKRDERVDVIHKENEGLSSARNAGIDRAQGEYIAFIDADDSIHEEFIEILYKLCKENECQIAQCNFLYVKEEEVELPISRQTDYLVMDNVEAVKKCCSGNDAVKYNIACNKLYKKELFSELRYPIGRIHEDEFTTYKVFWKASKIVVTDIYLYYYLQRKGSIIADKCNKNHLDRLDAYRERADYLKEIGMKDEYITIMIWYYHDIWRWYKQIKCPEEELRTIRKELEMKAASVKEEILGIPDRSNFDNLTVFYPYLSLEEKEEIKKIYGNYFENMKIERYVFPFHLIPQNSRIAIYGAGVVGSIFYQQLQKTKYCQIVVWVDNRWIEFDEIYGIQPIYSLVNLEYEYVVIAIKDELIVKDIKENLITWGIEENRIIWQDPCICVDG